MGQKRFKLGEMVRYRPLECYAKVIKKEKVGSRTRYKLKLSSNYQGKRVAYSFGTTIEHTWE